MTRTIISACLLTAIVLGCAAKAAPRTYGDDVMDAVRSRMNPMKECYATALVDEPDLEGRLMITFTIDATGRVMTAFAENEGETDLPTSVSDCIIDVLEATTFPPPEGEVEPTFSFPMTF